MSATPTDDLQRRALAAWFRTGGTGTPRASVVEHGGRQYVVLAGGAGTTLAVYRWRDTIQTPQLMRLRRWPTEVAPR